ncbi:MAG TPA: hypothetical protein VFF50_11835, partial [Candidatus Deferrimicrobiaceae bacterium]|nr:hypothetical protein [Candidatus Deferrimicrobiaceae bacterium]
MNHILVTLFVACISVSSGWAQGAMAPSSTPAAQSAAPVKDPVATSLRLLLTRSRNNTLGAIGAMPADKFSYK